MAVTFLPEPDPAEFTLDLVAADDQQIPVSVVFNTPSTPPNDEAMGKAFGEWLSTGALSNFCDGVLQAIVDSGKAIPPPST